MARDGNVTTVNFDHFRSNPISGTAATQIIIVEKRRQGTSLDVVE